MKFYFGEVPEQDVDNFGAQGLYYNEDKFYYFCVEFGTNPGGLEEVSIRDTCGRMVPVAMEFVGELTAILVECNNIASEIQSGKYLADSMLDDEATASVSGINIDYN